MSKIDKRLEELEAKIAPPGNVELIIQNKDESKAEAITRAGLTPEDLEEAARVLWVRFV